VLLAAQTFAVFRLTPYVQTDAPPYEEAPAEGVPA
jgi:hypothetical protein